MKKLLTILLGVLSLFLYAQTPTGFSYQAVLRNAQGEVVANQSGSLRVTITGSNDVDIHYQEEHAVQSSAQGLVGVIIGSGTNKVGNLVDVPWGTDQMKLKLEIKLGSASTYSFLGTQTLQAVPYALHASNAKSIESDPAASDEEPIFVVRNKLGQIVFAVYQEGVRVYVDDGTTPVKGSKGGFAVGGLSGTKESVEYFRITPDSARIYIDDSGKGLKGGFAVGGLSGTKANAEYLRITPDSARIYINRQPSVKGAKGGFAVGGLSGTKTIAEYLRVTADSTRIYVDETLKGVKGGFAVGGLSGTKATGEYLRVTPDSTRVFVTNQSATGSVGGFSVKSKEDKKDYFNVTGISAAEKIVNESRVMWYPKKSALLAGEISVANADSVGQYSMSMGYRNVAKGNWSQAMGSQCIARGDYSTAIGLQTVANTNSFAFGMGSKAMGYNSFAFGSKGVSDVGTVLDTYTEASGDHSFAFGLGSKSTALGSFVMGTNCTASGKFASAMGFNSQAIGPNSAAIGVNNVSSGLASFTLGYGNQATYQYAFAFGSGNTSSGEASVAFGLYNTASGNQSFVGGYQNTASGFASIALGSGNNVSGDGGFASGNGNICQGVYSTAFGGGNSAVGNRSFVIGTGSYAGSTNSIAMGYGTRATAESSFAVGYQDTASAQGAVAMGYRTSAKGNYSVATGYMNTVGTYAGFAIGRYNSITTGTPASWTASEALFIAGNGTSAAARNDALVLYKNGNMKLDGNFYPNDDNTNSLGLSSNRWTVVYATTGTINTSDIRQKKDILELKYGLNEVLKLKPVTFRWKKSESNKLNLGFIAQDVNAVLPEVVDEGKDPDKTLGINYSAIVPVLVKSIQEQQQEIESLKSKNAELESQLKQILEMLSKK